MEEQSPAAAAPTGSGGRPPAEGSSPLRCDDSRHGDGAEAVVSSRGVVR